MREIRWTLQASRKGMENWNDRNDRVYSGWFHDTGEAVVSESVLKEFKDAVAAENWLDWRLVQDTRSYSRSVIAEHRA